MVKFVIKLIIAILLFACCIYIEDYLQRGAGLFLGMGVTIIGLLIDAVFTKWEECREFLSVTGALLSLFFFFCIGLELHFKETPEGVKVRSAFYTHEIDSGDSLETKRLHSCYTQCYRKYDVKDDTYYFVYKGDSCSVYNMHGKVLKIPKSYGIKQKDFGHGELDYIVINGKTFDLKGSEIKDLDEYKPYVSDLTPNYTSSPLN